MIDRIDGAHMIAMPVLFLAAVALPDTERGSEQCCFDVVHTQRVSAQQRADVAFANQAGKRRGAAGVDHHGSSHDHDLLSR